MQDRADYKLQYAVETLKLEYENRKPNTTPYIRNKKLVFDWVRRGTISFPEFEFLWAQVEKLQQEENLKNTAGLMSQVG